MILVKNIEVVEVERDPWELLSLTKPYQAVEVFNPGKNVPEFIDTNVFREMVQGQRFRRPDGKELIIGYSKQVEEAVGLPFEIFKNMQDDIDDYRVTMRRQTDSINRYQSYISELGRAGFWKRIKYVFTRYRPNSTFKGGN